VRLVGFTIEIYYDARPCDRQIYFIEFYFLIFIVIITLFF